MDKEIAIKRIKDTFPNINWDKFEDIDRALNWELWHGILPANYWYEVEPLEHYEWKGYEQASKDIEELLESLPWQMWFDCDGDVIADTNPFDYDGYWNYRCTCCDEPEQLEYQFKDRRGHYISIEDGREHEPNLNEEAIWVGGEWELFDVRKVLMFDETFKQVF